MRYLLILIAGAATACGATPDSATRVVAGPLTITLHVSATAHVFHIVDQLAAWSPYCHEQYTRYFSDLTDDERALLAGHAALRQAKPWGQGLEQTFYTDLSLEEALKAGVAEGHLTEEQAEIERRVLTAFTPRADALMESHSERTSRRPCIVARTTSPISRPKPRDCAAPRRSKRLHTRLRIRTINPREAASTAANSLSKSRQLVK